MRKGMKKPVHMKKPGAIQFPFSEFDSFYNMRDKKINRFLKKLFLSFFKGMNGWYLPYSTRNSPDEFKFQQSFAESHCIMEHEKFIFQYYLIIRMSIKTTGNK
jgi:hypothetical protein